MSRRIEIELTSARPDGTWTWRAAGAREPKGVLDGGLLQAGAKQGDVLRVDADFEIEGIVITNVLPPKEKRREEPQRIELLGTGDVPGVTTQLVAKGGRDRGPRRDGERRDGPPRSDRARGDGPRSDRPRSDRPRGDGPRGDGPRGDGSRGDGSRGDRPVRSEGTGSHRGAGAAGADRPGGRDRTGGAGPDGERRVDPARPRAEGARTGGPRREGGRGEPVDRSRARRLNPGHAHRQAVVATLKPEEQAVADQVLRGGLPAVRTALHLEREKATAEGRPVPDTEALLALAEELLPRLKAAEWKDRAEAAVKAGADIALRDLRSVVAGADVARDEEARELASQLRSALDHRVETQRSEWTNDLTRHLDEGRVVRALQLSGRPPDPSTRLTAEMAARVAEVASAAMTPEVPADRWLALLDAVAASPVRRSVQPVGLPAEPGPDLLRAAHQQSGRIPALAAMLGVTMPPPPGPRVPPPPGAGRSRRPGSRRPEGSPAASRPGGVGSATTMPAPAPAPTDPAPTDLAPTGPAPTGPAPTDLAPTDPAPTDLAPTDPAPTDPAPTDPAPTDPELTPSDSTDPAPTDPEPQTGDVQAVPGGEATEAVPDGGALAETGETVRVVVELPSGEFTGTPPAATESAGEGEPDPVATVQPDPAAIVQPDGADVST